MIISYFFIALTREPDSIKPVTEALPADFWKKSGNILRSNRNFSVFLAIRSLSQFAVMGFSFYTIYAVWHFGINDFIAGVMTTVFLLANILASLLMGRWADRWSPRKVMAIGALGSALGALLAPEPVGDLQGVGRVRRL